VSPTIAWSGIDWVIVAETSDGKLKRVEVVALTEVGALVQFQKEHPTWKAERVSRK
jgi:hypothetical protein